MLITYFDEVKYQPEKEPYQWFAGIIWEREDLVDHQDTSADYLYKYVAELEIAHAISNGVYRFYDLTKYMNMEDEHGRTDEGECSVTFQKEEYESAPEKLPVGSFRGVEFHCASMKPDDDYISQYFVFCMGSRVSDGVIGDSRYRVEVNRDVFDLLSTLLNPSDTPFIDEEGRKTFSHGAVEYYDIHNHPNPLSNQMWREVFVKHRSFMHQREYRASLFISDARFNRICNEGEVTGRDVYDVERVKMDFRLEFHLRAGRDGDGWRYIEIDTSEFAENLKVGPSKIVELA